MTAGQAQEERDQIEVESGGPTGTGQEAENVWVSRRTDYATRAILAVHVPVLLRGEPDTIARSTRNAASSSAGHPAATIPFA